MKIEVQARKDEGGESLEIKKCMVFSSTLAGVDSDTALDFLPFPVPSSRWRSVFCL